METTLKDAPNERSTRGAEANALERHRSLVENAMSGVGLLAKNGRWIAANPALSRMLGYPSEEELLALAPGAWFADPADLPTLLKAAENGSLSRGRTLHWRRRDQSDVVVRISGQGVVGRDDQVGAVEVLVEDVTERRHLEEQLRQAQKMEAIGALTGGIAHDFNNILTIVLSNADMIADGLPPESFHLRSDLEELQRAARRGADLIGKLLSFSRRQELRSETVELGRLVRDATDMIRRLLPAPVTLEVEMDRRASYLVHADATAIQQILLNLTTTARDAMPDGGPLTIRVEHAGPGAGETSPRVRLSVRDTGTGMDAHVRQRVFEPVFTTKESGRGTGLGLPMVYALATQLGGTVDIDTVPGRGTNVRLQFPAVEGAESSQDQAVESPSTQAQVGCVLIAEDDEVIRRSVKRVLERNGLTAVPTSDGKEALDWLEEHGGEVDLVITDLVMPRMGGVELFRTARARGDTTRFLFTSGYIDDTVRREVDADPDLVFLPKPWTVAELVASVGGIIGEGRCPSG